MCELDFTCSKKGKIVELCKTFYEISGSMKGEITWLSEWLSAYKNKVSFVRLFS
jgi:hypothetical protein